MEINSWLLLPILFAASLTLISKLVENRRRNLPPGPEPWPIIGNLNLLGSIPHQSLHYLSKKYGEIMLLKFGKFPVIVVSSPNMAKQFLKVHDADFASRPSLAAGKYASYNYSDVSWAPYGPYWRQARKIYLSEVFNAKKLEFFEQIRAIEARGLLSRLHGVSGRPVVLRDELQRYTLSTVSRMLSRDVYFATSEEDELRGMVDEWFFLTGVFNIGDWIPWLSFLDLQGYVKRMKMLSKKFDRVFDYVIDEHLAKRAKDDKGFKAKDIVDVFLQISEDPNLDVELTRDNVKALIQNLIVGATDTIATTIEWAINEVLRHPHTIKKAKEELDDRIGRGRWAKEADSSQLPYIESIIMETFRLHPPSTLIPRYAISNCNVAGYDVAKGTTVFINTWSIGRDPNTWHEPEKFMPERFMGKEIHDASGSNYSLLPFGSGRRRCPGYRLALKIAPTMFANLLHGFDFKLVEGMKPQDICMEEEYGLTTHPKLPLSIIMDSTLPPHLY